MRTRRRIVAAVLAAVLVPPAALWAYVEATGNFGAVEPGRVYRSAQLRSGHLTRTLRAHRIRTVLNLRGPNPDQPWYRAERAATLASGATQVDVSLSSCEWMSRAQLRTLIRVHDASEYPLLIHCEHGSERTSLVAAVFELLRPGATLRDAERQFTLRHLFLPYKDGKVMWAHLQEYEDWLRARGRGHTPEHFREWAAGGYTPHWPTREMWPYDPKPLLAVTRPEPPAPAVAGSNGPAGRR